MSNKITKSIALLGLSMALSSGAAVASANQSQDSAFNAVQNTVQTVMVNGKTISSGYLQSGGKEVMLPLRDLVETLGMTLKWNPDDKSSEITKGTLWTTVKTGEDRYTINKMYTSLGTAPVIVNNKLYVPASFASEVLHAIVKVEGSSVSISFPEQEKTATTQGVITEIKDNDGHISIHLNGIQGDGIVLNVSKDTVFQTSEAKALKLSDLTLGMSVKAEHSLATTMSLPPQTAVYTLTVTDKIETAEIIGTAGTIAEVRTNEAGVDKSILIKGLGLTEQSPKEVVLNLSKDTVLVDQNGMKVEQASLVKDAKVIGFYTPMLTRSLPPIGNATKIMLQIATENTEPAL
ncbi:copper amine oxidase N-terminal domain-containing protein [Paenibacillus pini]|uniref:Protease inhibitor n=1 Tax=Paenibacillus pini JCM 16418 TaxID=1236976 RepID=W7YCE5_9BACL|nr:copper amine oxidase N-terminal domain-containing protein [Paenibacillus pini]GAF08580.1 protease inhibitor precursor [Paenibacillus pini JCM 16418]